MNIICIFYILSLNLNDIYDQFCQAPGTANRLYETEKTRYSGKIFFLKVS